MKILNCFLALLLSSSAVVSAQNTPAIEELLKKVEALGAEAAKLKTPLPPANPIIKVDPTEDLQAIVNTAKPNTTILLQAGELYKGSIIVPKAVVGLTITTDHFNIGPRMVLKSDMALMAMFQSTPGQSYGLWLMGSQVKVIGIQFLSSPNLCQGDMVRVGDSTNPNIADTPDDIILSQIIYSGNTGTDCGQKRGIAANGSHLLIEKSYADNIWVPGQDSQCVAIFSTQGPVTIRDNYFSCGSENILVGGVPPAAKDLLPSDILIEHNVLTRPLSWKTLSNHQVKNLIEVKLGHRIMIRRNWLENHWVASQPGYAVVLTMATNGACSWCDMQEVAFEYNVVWNASAGINLMGFQYLYAPGAGQAVGFTIRGNLFYLNKSTMGGNARFLVMSGQPKNILVDHNTVIHDGTAVVAGDYGIKWPYQEPPLLKSIPAGPVEGFVYTNNLMAHSSYGIFTPEGHSGTNLATYFPGAVIGSNVWGGASSTAITKYNAFTAGPTPTNVSQLMVDFNVQVNTTKCPQSTFAGVGADCSKLPYDLQPLVSR